MSARPPRPCSQAPRRRRAPDSRSTRSWLRHSGRRRFAAPGGRGGAAGEGGWMLSPLWRGDIGAAAETRVLHLAATTRRFSCVMLIGAPRSSASSSISRLRDAALENMETYGVPRDRYEFVLGAFLSESRGGAVRVVFCFGILYHLTDHMVLLSKIAARNPWEGGVCLARAFRKSIPHRRGGPARSISRFGRGSGVGFDPCSTTPGGRVVRPGDAAVPELS